MEALTGIIGKLGTFMSGTGGKAIGAIGAGDQFINNWMNQRKMNDYYKQQQMYQKHPGIAQNEITGMTQPLDQNLVASVTNQVKGDAATRGLADSPNIMAMLMGQALAPYNQQNMDQATRLWQSIHGQPPPFAPPANMSPLFSMLMRGNQSPNQVPDTSEIPSPVPGIIDWFMPGGDSSAGANDLSQWGLGPSQATA
jgi:hypothetical protein